MLTTAAMSPNRSPARNAPGWAWRSEIEITTAIAGALTRTTTLVAANAASQVATAESETGGAIALKTTIASELLRLNRARLNASFAGAWRRTRTSATAEPTSWASTSVDGSAK